MAFQTDSFQNDSFQVALEPGDPGTIYPVPPIGLGVFNSLIDAGAAPLDIQRADYSIMLQIVRGYNEIAEVRGHDTIVPGLPGRVLRNRVKDRREIELYGIVQGNADYLGTGPNETDRMASFRFLVWSLQAYFDPTGVVTLNVVPENAYGASTQSIRCRALSMVWSPDDLTPPGMKYVSIVLESFTPEWE